MKNQELGLIGVSMKESPEYWDSPDKSEIFGHPALDLHLCNRRILPFTLELCLKELLAAQLLLFALCVFYVFCKCLFANSKS